MRIKSGSKVEDVEKVVVIGVADASKVGAREIVREEPKSLGGGAIDEEEGPSLTMRELESPPPVKRIRPVVPVVEDTRGSELAHKRGVVGLGTTVESAAVLFGAYNFVVMDMSAAR